MNIKNLKNITIQQKVVNTNKFQVPIYLNFIPQYMKIKLLSFNLEYDDIMPENDIYVIKSSLVNNDVLTHFTLNNNIDPLDTIICFTESLDLTFKLYDQIINNTYTFEILQTENNIATFANMKYSIAITLEFIEYL